MTELTVLALKHGTDKAGHGYCPHYERFVGELHLFPITMIEIGVASGASLRMWQEWMPKAKIVGLDMNDYQSSPIERVSVVKGNQAENSDLERLVQETGSFQFVVDDGGHDSEQQKISFNYLFPRLVHDGWYAIEDSYGIGSCVDLESIARGDGDIKEFHLVNEGSGSVLALLKKR